MAVRVCTLRRGMAALPASARGWAPVHAQKLRRPVDRAGPRRLDFPPRDDGLRRCIMPRIFIALPVDAAVRRAIAGAIPKEDGAVRWVKEHQYHITLKFLGEISEHELQQTCAAVEQVGRAWTEPLHLAVRGVGVQHGSGPRRLGRYYGRRRSPPAAQRGASSGQRSRGAPSVHSPRHGRAPTRSVPCRKPCWPTRTSTGTWTVPAVPVVETRCVRRSRLHRAAWWPFPSPAT